MTVHAKRVETASVYDFLFCLLRQENQGGNEDDLTVPLSLSLSRQGREDVVRGRFGVYTQDAESTGDTLIQKTHLTARSPLSLDGLVLAHNVLSDILLPKKLFALPLVQPCSPLLYRRDGLCH